MKTTFTARRLYTPLEEIPDPLLTVEDGRITEVASRTGKDLPGGWRSLCFVEFTTTEGAPPLRSLGG